MKTTPRTWLTTGAVGLAGLAAGGILATTVSATAEDAPNGDIATQADQSQPQRSDRELLTGDTAESVRKAVLAEYPGATVVRLETDSGGVYEAHITTADGEPVTVLVDEDFEVTGEEEHGPGHHGRGHGPGGPGGPVEEELTGATADSVRNAALTEYPGATVVRVETDSDGVYEAHLVKGDGTPITVLVNEEFEITGEEEGGLGHHDLDGDDADVDDEASTEDTSAA